MKNQQYVEHKMFIDELEKRKSTIRCLLDDYESKLQGYLTREERTEKSYQNYLNTLRDRDEQLALLAELCSCSFITQPEPSFQQFLVMDYNSFDYEKEFRYAF